MKKVLCIGVATLVTVWGYGLSGVFAQGDAAPESVSASITGVNIGLISTFAQGEGASANSSLAQMNALKVQEAKSADGAVLPEFSGKILYYLPSKSADTIITGSMMRGKTLTVTGSLFKSESLLLVKSVEAQANQAATDEWNTFTVGEKSQVQLLTEEDEKKAKSKNAK